jgi:sugar lactone lactonase YvrE
MWNSNGITFANQSIVGDDPDAIFVNTNNTIYVANEENNQILVWNEGSESPTKIVSGNFTNTSSLFVTSNGDIYIDDGEENGRVQKWISTTETFDTVMNVDSSCYGLFVDIKDNLYCSMSYYHRVVKRSLNDPVMTTVVVAGTGNEGWASYELNFPYGIFVDVNLDLYVADCDNNRVQLFQSGQLNGITLAGSTSPYPTIALDGPDGISLDAEKYLFIVDSDNHRIVRFGPNGFRCLVGCYGYGSQSNQLDSPSSFSFDRSGNLFVTDSHNHRIQKFLLMENSSGKVKKIE